LAVTAKFSADFSSFIQAIDKAEIALVDFGKGAGKVESSLNRMVDNFSGRKLVQEASLMTIAVEKAGGVAKLTAQEIERVGAKANEAADKMKRLGYEVPAGLQKLADETKNASVETDSLGLSFTKFVGGLVTAQAILGAIKGVFNAFTGEISSSIKAAGDAEKAHVQLVAALRAQGTAVPSVITAFQGYATALQKTTIYQDDAVESAAALLVTIGNVMPRDMEKALKATTNLASGLGIDLDSAARTVAKAAEGNTTALRKVGVVMDDTKGKTHDFGQVLDAITAKFGGQAEAIAGTYQGRLAQLGNTWNNVEESIGRVITQNATVLKAMNSVNTLIDEQTGELNENATANNLVSTSVIGLVKVMAGLAQAVESVVGVFEPLNLAAAKFERIKLNLSDPLGQSIEVSVRLKEVNADIDAMTASIAKGGDGGKGLAKTLNDLAAKLEETRGKTVALSDVTDGAANAWNRHTVAVHQTSEAEKKFAEAMAELNSAGEGWRGTLDGIDGAVVESVKSYIAANVEQDKLATAFGLTAVQVKAIESAFKAEKEAAKDIQEIHNKIEAGLYGIHTAVAFVDESELKWVETQIKVADALKMVERSIPSAVAGFYSLGGSLENVGQKSTEIDQIRVKLKLFESTATAVFQRLPQTLIAAFTGGGGIIGGLKAFGTDMGAALFGPKGAFASVTKSATAGLTKLFGSTIGGALGAAIPGIGALIGPAIEGLSKLFGKIFGGPSQAELDGRKLEASFEAQFGSFQKMLNAVGDVYKATGRTYEMATADVKALLDAEKQGGAAVQTVLDKINGAFNEQAQDAADLTAAIEKYGFTIEQLGPAMQKQKLDDQAKELANSWRLLVGSGIDVVAVDQKMAATTWDYLQIAKKTGQEVPAAMKPIIQSMLDQGVFTDEAGNKLTDMAQLGIKFSETMSAGFDRVVDKLQTLLEGLGLVPKALDAIPNTKTIDIGFNVANPPNYRDGDNYAAHGGLVTNTGIQYLAGGGNVLRWRPRGSDTVPAMLTPGEGVVSRRGMQTLGADGLSKLNAGGSAGARTISFGDVNIIIPPGTNVNDPQALALVIQRILRGDVAGTTTALEILVDRRIAAA
jgi:hypothetical protein